MWLWKFDLVRVRAVQTKGSRLLDCLLKVCIIHTMNSAELIKRMEQAGWKLRGVKGSHHIYMHPVRGGHISVPHPKKDLGAGLVHKLLKQAGLSDERSIK